MERRFHILLPLCLGTMFALVMLSFQHREAVSLSVRADGLLACKIADGVDLDMKRIEGGTFMMGSSESAADVLGNEKPAHSVTLNKYAIGVKEVSQELWEYVMGSNPSIRKGANLPVENVSWDDCQRFIRELNAKTGGKFRLPTEAEWEYAARGGSKSQQFRYAGSDNPDDVAWYAENSGGTTHDVGLKFPNTTEVNDMSGNVSEWVQDNYNEYSSYPQTNPCVSKESEVHVIRGGSYLSDVRSIRVTARDGEKASYRSPAVGFRLAVSL